jgi:DNA-binding Lrp family transcriptional regulator
VTLPTRRLYDPRTIRAMAHPLRLRLLELLFTEGPLTASRCAEHVGESPASCSFHLRQLAKYGDVEEAGGGRGRERPWQAVLETTELRESELTPEAALAADELLRVLSARQVELHERYWRTRRDYPKQWQDAAIETNVVAFVTAEEMAEFKVRMRELVLDFANRYTTPGPRRPGAEPVALIVQGFPMQPPRSAPPADPPDDPPDDSEGAPTGDEPDDIQPDGDEPGSQPAEGRTNGAAT